MGDAQRVLVVGGGIAGLATARALRRRGIEPEVVERAAAWSQPGAGVYLPANSVRALGALGLQAALLDRACQITRQRFLNHRGRLLLDVDLPAVWGATGPCAAISHRGLHQLLCEGIPVRLGRTVSALDARGPLVRAVFDDGSTGDYGLVVGADGVRSWVRTVVLKGAAPRFLGQVAWRFLVDGVTEITAWTVWAGRGTTFLTIPLGGGRIYCWAGVDTQAPTDPSGGDPAGLGELFGGVRRAGPHDRRSVCGRRRPAVFLAVRGGRPAAVGARPHRASGRRRPRDVAQHGRGRRDGAGGRPRPGRDGRRRAAAQGVRGAAPTPRQVRPDADPPA
jgi:2-polyprenyl-6-methoxyphenol hydroxylase-like FAD-dependent oxidoreductase